MHTAHAHKVNKIPLVGFFYFSAITNRKMQKQRNVYTHCYT